jgi:TLC domain
MVSAVLAFVSTAWQSYRVLASAFGASVVPRTMTSSTFWPAATTTTTTRFDTTIHTGSDGSIHTTSNVCLLNDGSAIFFLQQQQQRLLAATAMELEVDGTACAGTDWFILVMLFVVVHTISWSGRWTVWEPFYRWHRGTKGSIKDMQNFSQTLTAGLFCSLSAYFGYRVLTPKEWLYNRNEWFQVSHFMDADFKFYYLLYAARYLSDSVSLCYEHTRSDTPAYVVHHFTTLALMLVSAQTGYLKAGGIITYFFDWADPFMLLAKACKYLSSREDDMYQFVTNRLFEVFAVVFVVTRNVMFNYIVYCAFAAHYNNDDDDDASTATVRRVLLSLLVLLAFVMTYWLVLIVQAAIYQLRHSGNVDDIREDEVVQKSKLGKRKEKST